VAANASQITQIGSLEEPRIFTLDEANELFPLVRRITHDAYRKLEPIKRRLENMLATDPRMVVVEKEYEAVVKRWVRKMERLGLVVQGLWLVDFDTGDGYLCWKYPELRIGHFHDYTSGFSGRRPLSEIIEELDPDWA
jgi:hypothetical protein